jgi:hypothetical protein
MTQKIETALKSINTIAEFVSKISNILGGKETPASTSNTEAVTTRQYTTEFLKKDQLLTIIKENLVPGANQSCVMKSANETHLLIYVAFAKDRNLLPTTENVYICITCKAISRELENMFNKHELIIIE